MLDHDVYLVSVFHLKRVGRIIILDPLPIENETALVVCESLPLAICVHQLLQLSSPFNFEEDLSSVLGLDLYIDVLLLVFIVRIGCAIFLSISLSSSLIIVIHFCQFFYFIQKNNLLITIFESFLKWND